MGSAAKITEPTTGTEKHRPVEVEEEDEQIVDLERKTSPFRHGKGLYSDNSTITTTNTSTSSSFSGDGPEGSPSFRTGEEEHISPEKLDVPESPEQDSESGLQDENNCNVYFDGEHGIWKCRHCDWTYRETKESAGAESDAHESLNDEKKQLESENSFSTFEGSREIEEVKEENFVKELDAIDQPTDDVNEEEVEIDDAEDFDEEKVLDNQETHALLCPNCNSCITKRVVLKRRKRKIRHVLEDPKRLRGSDLSDPPLYLEDNFPFADIGESSVHESFMFKSFTYFSLPKGVMENGDRIVISSPPNARIDTPPVSLLEEGNLREPLIRPVVEGRKQEIWKSIVYGGLIESITALGVISSASASGASTLNILVLGLTNILGGLILMIHHLLELRDEESIRITTSGQEEEGRYKRLLGRRENFMLHATVAILSFIIVGLIPLVVYFVSFSKTHNRDYKAASVFGSSLLCIVFLAIAKTRVITPRESYLERILYYATIAVLVAWISYKVGNFLEQYFEKNGWSEGSETPVGHIMLSLMGRKAGSFGYS